MYSCICSTMAPTSSNPTVRDFWNLDLFIYSIHSINDCFFIWKKCERHLTEHLPTNLSCVHVCVLLKKYP